MSRLLGCALLLAFAAVAVADENDGLAPPPASTKPPTTPTPPGTTKAGGTAPVASPGTAAISTATKPKGKGLIAVVPNPNRNIVGGGGGGGGGGGSKSDFTGTELKFPEEKKKDKKDGKDAKGEGGATGEGGKTATGNGGGGSSTPDPTPAIEGSATPEGGAGKEAAAAKTSHKGRIVLFLRTPGEEGVDESDKIRWDREGKIAKRLSTAFSKGETAPATTGEEGVLRDPTPEGFFLPDEVDAWLCGEDGTLSLLELDATTFNTTAALGLGAQVTIEGPAKSLELADKSLKVTSIKVKSVAKSGAPAGGGGAGGGGTSPPPDGNGQGGEGDNGGGG